MRETSHARTSYARFSFGMKSSCREWQLPFKLPGLRAVIEGGVSEYEHDDYLAPQVELLDYDAMKRVCYTCFEGDS